MEKTPKTGGWGEGGRSNRAGDNLTKAQTVVMEAGDLTDVVISNSEVLLFKKKKNCQGRKVGSELRLKEISRVDGKLFIKR